MKESNASVLGKRMKSETEEINEPVLLKRADCLVGKAFEKALDFCDKVIAHKTPEIKP